MERERERERERGKVSNKEYTKFGFEIQFFGLSILIFFWQLLGERKGDISASVNGRL